MEFSSVDRLVWLWLIVPAVILVLWGRARLIQRQSVFGDQNLLDKFWSPRHIWSLSTELFFVLFILVLLIISISKPRLGFQWRKIHRQGVDIMIGIDVSNSMLANDVKPNRLERAKRELIDFLKIVQGDRVGLIAFAGVSFIQCPLTLDYNSLRMFIDMLSTNLIPVQGTDLSKVISLTIQNTKNHQNEHIPALILITDGEDQNTYLEASLLKAKKHGLRIYTIGIGNPQGAPIPMEDGTLKKDNQGNVVMSKLGEKKLMKIAIETGGRYVRSVTGDLDLEKIYLEGIKKTYEKQDFDEIRQKIWHERYYWFTLVAFCLLCVDFWFRAIYRFQKRS